ncbi:MAG: glycoside hydrolase family 19 protein [Vulcanimicrobiota bacterium]
MYQATITTLQINANPGAATPGLGMPMLDSSVSQRCLGLNNTCAMPGVGLTGFPNSGYGMDPSMMLLMQQMETMELMLDMMALMLGAGGGLQNALGMGAPAGVSSAGSGGGASASGSATGTGSTSGTQAFDAARPITANVENLVNALDPGYREAARANFPIILGECQKQGVTDKAQIAYILATTVHESGAGKYMEEFASGEAYEGRGDLGNNQAGDGKRYKGRGYVQITGRNNYTNWSKKLGLDLVGNPDLAKKPEIAARILVEGMKEGSFTGKKLSDFIGGGKQDFEGARRIVNGTDKAGTFANTARKLMAAMG